jgi:Ser/Thr protein kinase RdoA (MazF antagonist)
VHPARWGATSSGHVLEYVPGETAYTLAPLTAGELRQLGAFVHELHDASESFKPPPVPQWNVVIAPDREDLVCHYDLAPWNLVRDGESMGVHRLGWCGPGSRLWDLAYTASTFVPLCAGGDPVVDGPRLRALADGYGLDEQQRRAFPALIAAHTRGMYDLLHSASLTGEQPWARLYAEGHGEHWGPADDNIEAHFERWTAALLE